jgi:hypothetical protein
MSWITLTVSDLRAYLVAEQLAALSSEALDADQADPFTEVMPDVVRMMRAYIASNPENRVDSAELTLPPELKLDVTYLILAPLLGRLGIPLTKDQAAALDRAHSTLIALREKKLVVSQPDNAVAPSVQGGPSVELASAPTRQTSRASLDRL